MSGKTITLIGATPESLGNGLIAAALAKWSPESDCPSTVSLTFDQVIHDEKSLDKCGVAWIHLDATEPKGLYALLGLLQDRHMPAMLTRPGETLALGSTLHDGVVIGSPGSSPEALCSILRTLWCQAGVVSNLRREIRVLRAHQGGLSDQIDKIDEELRLAAQLQREFLPNSLPDVGPLEFRVLFRPAGYVSGDIYDVIRLDEDHVGFFVADAVGHGVPAALMTMFIKRALRTKEIDPTSPQGYRIVPPNETLAQLNHDMLLHQNTGKIRFATACYGVLNWRTLEMKFSRAGHPFPLLLHADGTTQSISPDGGMLGIFPDEVFEVASVQLRPGDRLLLYSDGFEVAFPTGSLGPNSTQSMANDQYEHEFRQLAHGSLDEALGRLVDRLDHATGSLNQQDDLTVVCLGVRGVEGPAPTTHAAVASV